MKMQRVAVVGAGTMGSGIAQVLSQIGLEVLLKDVNEEAVGRGMSAISKMYDSRVRKEVLTRAEADTLFSKVKGTTTFAGFEKVDLVIEAALEEMSVKLAIFRELDQICPPTAVLASNTSALSITEIASGLRHPERVIGMHFFNPAQIMKLVEVIPGLSTSSQVVEQVVQLCQELNKIPVKVKECPGFLVNRLLFPYLNETLYVLTERIISPVQIDQKAVQYGMPMGPCALLDMTGLDVCLKVNEFLYVEYGSRFTPAVLLKIMVEKGFLGQKNGAGFYLYPASRQLAKDEPRCVNPELEALLSAAGSGNGHHTISFDIHRIILPMFNEAIYAIQEQVVETADVDVAMQWGCGMKNGLLSLAKAKGLSWCLKELESYRSSHGERFHPSWLLRKLVRGHVHDFSGKNLAPTTVQ